MIDSSKPWLTTRNDCNVEYQEEQAILRNNFILYIPRENNYSMRMKIFG